MGAANGVDQVECGESGHPTNADPVSGATINVTGFVSAILNALRK